MRLRDGHVVATYLDRALASIEHLFEEHDVVISRAASQQVLRPMEHEVPPQM